MRKSIEHLVKESDEMYDEFPPDSKGAGVINTKWHQTNINSSATKEIYFYLKRKLTEFSSWGRRAYRGICSCFVPD